MRLIESTCLSLIAMLGFSVELHFPVLFWVLWAVALIELSLKGWKDND